MLLKCKECNELREEQYFSKTKNKNKSKSKDKIPYYFWLKKCKVCQGIKVLRGDYIDNKTKVERKIQNGITLSKDTEVFLNTLKIRNGYVDMIDSFKLAHYFIETFGYIDLDDMEIKDQLILMYDKLLQIQNGDSRA